MRFRSFDSFKQNYFSKLEPNLIQKMFSLTEFPTRNVSPYKLHENYFNESQESFSSGNDYYDTQ